MNRHERRQAKKQSNAPQPQPPDQLDQLGAIAKQQEIAGRFDLAEQAYYQILAIRPNYAEVYYNLGYMLEKQNKLAKAVECYDRALGLKPELAAPYNGYGRVLLAQNRHEEALTWFQKALAINPDYAEANNNIGIIMMTQNRADEAIARFRQALAIRSDFAEAHYHLASLKNFRPDDADLAALEALATKMDYLPPSKRLLIHFGLGKALNDIGDYDRAFEHLAKGNALKRQEIHYSEAESIQQFQVIADIFNSSLFDRLHGTGDPSHVPIFILGMPRSGSTLVEQILASHPQVHAGGELINMNLLADNLIGTNGERIAFPAYAPLLTATNCRELGQAYVKSLPQLSYGKTRVTDKMLSNFMFIGLIRLILPNAKIIHTMRDPIDTCFSCFQNLFRLI